MEHMKKVTVYDVDGIWNLPTEASAFMQFWQDELAKIPAEYLDSACIEVESQAGYEGSSSLNGKVYYYRPETEQEKSAREHREERDREIQTEYKRRQLERLKKELGEG